MLEIRRKGKRKKETEKLSIFLFISKCLPTAQPVCDTDILYESPVCLLVVSLPTQLPVNGKAAEDGARIWTSG